MKLVKIAMVVLLLALYGCKSSNELILSENLELTFNSPILLAHTYNSLIVKYDDWWFSHEVIDSSRMYPGFDLGENFREYIYSLFDPALQESLPDDLAKMSAQQRAKLGINEENIIRKNIGGAEVLAVYDTLNSKGYVFVLEKLITHRIDTSSDLELFNNLLVSIKER